MTQRVAVIGAGLSGLACARVLRQAGLYVEIFEQGRIIGGRMATARVGPVSYDHGAQYITARSTGFRAYVDELVGTGYASHWQPKTVSGDGQAGAQLLSWFVGLPGMSSIVRPLAESVRIHTNRKVHTISREAKGWHIWFEDESQVGPFSAVAIAVPAPQARFLLGPMAELAEPLSAVRLNPIWSLSLLFDQRVLPDQDVYSDMSELIRWVSRDSSKPGRRSKGETVVIHASQAFSRETSEDEPEAIAEELWGEVCNVLSLPPVTPTHMTAHLWRHGLVDASLGESFIYSTEHRVGVAGDWCLGRLAEHAFESGIGLGKSIVSSLD